MKIHIVIDLAHGEESNPGIRAYRSEASAIAEEARLLGENAESLGEGEYLVVRETIDLED